MSEAEVRDYSVEMLQTYLSSIIESIVNSVDQCPSVMRVAFKQLHKRVEEQFTEPENEVSVEPRIETMGEILWEIILTTCFLLNPGCKIPGHQRVLLPAFLCSCYPDAKAVPAERPAR